MSRIEELIERLCPDGVEYKKLGEVCEIFAGGDLPLEFVKGQKEPSKEFPYPIYSNGSKENSLYGFSKSYKVDVDAVTISARGTIGYHEIRRKKFTPIIRLITLYPKDDTLALKYLRYALDLLSFANRSDNGGIPQLTVPKTKQFLIPVPPLEVQQEIVRILDNFTNLCEKLNEELELRKKQYEYYREKLLSFEGEEVEWKKLGEIGTFVRGNGLQKKDFVSEGVGCIHYGQIFTNYGTYASKTKTFVTPELAKKLRKAQKGDLVIATTSENVEDVCKAVAWLGEEDIAISGDAYLYRHQQDPKYMSYLFQSSLIYMYKQKVVTGTKVIRVSGDSMAKFLVPIPPLPEQQRIVSILDAFDTLINDTKKGLPAEIAALNQQYEYYRDQLLTFKQK